MGESKTGKKVQPRATPKDRSIVKGDNTRTNTAAQRLIDSRGKTIKRERNRTWSRCKRCEVKDSSYFTKYILKCRSRRKNGRLNELIEDAEQKTPKKKKTHNGFAVERKKELRF